MKVPIDDIKVEKRFRKDFGGIDELAESIKKHGLIQPPVVTDNLKLVAGERRLRACKELGFEEIEVRLREDLDELEQREMELEENIARKQFTWQEEVQAKKEIHELKQEIHGSRVKGHESDGWGVKDTAEVLEEAIGGVSMDITLAKALEEYPELYEEKNKHQAMKKYKKLQEQELLDQLAEKVEDKSKGDLYEIYCENCISWMQEQEDESFDLAIVDPPWGIDVDTKSAMSKGREIEYDDDLEKSYLITYKALLELGRILKKDSHMYLYFGISRYDLILDTLDDISIFEYDPVPLIWNKDHGSSAAKGRTYPGAYETVLFCYKGKRDIKTGRHNVFTFKRPSGQIRVHSAQKPIALEEEFIKNSTNPGDRVIVPFAGSGAAVVAAVNQGCHVVGLEKRKKNFTVMDDFIKEQLAEEAMQSLKES